MSSHREAPEISKDPVADSTDVYAFVSPDNPDTVTLIANYIPLQAPAGGPNFYEFGDDVLYSINVDNDGDGLADVSFQFRFTTQLADPNVFLYNTGQILSIGSPNWNSKQFYSVTEVREGGPSTVLGTNLPCPPCNIGPASTPTYPTLAAEAVHSLGNGYTVFAGQRREGFFVDLGAIFDLGDLRPFQGAHIVPLTPTNGVNATALVNVHSIAIQVPKTCLTANGASPTSVTSPTSVIGVWTTAARQTVRITEAQGNVWSGPYTQVSRLGNPLINEVIIPLGQKDYWNTQSPAGDSRFLASYQHPTLAALLPSLYPHAFPSLTALNAAGTARADLVAILLTGIPNGIVPGFQNYTGPLPADELRLNLAIPPTTSNPSPAGVVGGDLAGFPNGRRVFDDVVTIELRAVAGVTYKLIDANYVVDTVAAEVTDGVSVSPTDPTYQSSFPYLGLPLSGFDVPAA